MRSDRYVMTALSRARMGHGGAEEKRAMAKPKSENGKHRTTDAKEFVARDRRAQSEDEFDNLPRQSESANISGWFTPRSDKPLPQVVKGTIIDCRTRKNPRRSQNPRYLLIELAAPVVGLRIADDAEGVEDTLEPGEVIGIDMRQALEKLAEHRGKVKITFLEKLEVEDRTWWKTEVRANLSKTSKQKPESEEDIDNLPF